MSIKAWGRRAESDAGSALVELAVALPLLVLILVATIDFGRVFYLSMALTNAARAGAQYGSFSAARSADTAGMQTTATSSLGPFTGVTAVASRTCQCATDLGVFSATTPTANDCTSPVTTTCPSKHLVITVTVTASKSFFMVMNRFPGIPSALSVSRSATLRVPSAP